MPVIEVDTHLRHTVGRSAVHSENAARIFKLEGDGPYRSNDEGNG
ncbi:MAG TPA: hypothetical protein VLX85_12410 [Stellaceae bacterium]|nr:hypothetical protein [Stellaceae bacterium]